MKGPDVNAAAPTPTREALAELRAATLVLQSFRLPDLGGSARAVEKLGADQIVPAKPKESVLEEARRALVAAAASGKFGNVSPKYMRQAAWLLWTERGPLASLPGLLEEVHALATRFRSLPRKLIQGWLLGFDPAAPRIEEGGHVVRRLLATNGDIRLDIWRRADNAFALFDARVGPGQMAAAILSSEQPLDDILRAAGLAEPLQAVGGYARAIQREVLDQIGAALRKPNAEKALARCVAFLVPDDGLRFDDGQSRGAIADGLLAPWLGDSAPPSDSIRATVQSFLLRHLGDPRIRPQRWTKARTDVVALMRKWLDRASFKAFFELIEELASDKQWRYRKAFWSAYLEEGHVDEVWLALASSLHAGARAVKDLNGAFARLSGASHQAVMIFRIRHLILCEWSNVGKLRAWPSNSKTSPALDKTSYDAREFMTPSIPFAENMTHLEESAGLSHFGPEQGSWQIKAARFISRHAGIRLMGPADWMPR